MIDKATKQDKANAVKEMAKETGVFLVAIAILIAIIICALLALSWAIGFISSFLLVEGTSGDNIGNIIMWFLLACYVLGVGWAVVPMAKDWYQDSLWSARLERHTEEELAHRAERESPDSEPSDGQALSETIVNEDRDLQRFEIIPEETVDLGSELD